MPLRRCTRQYVQFVLLCDEEVRHTGLVLTHEAPSQTSLVFKLLLADKDPKPLNNNTYLQKRKKVGEASEEQRGPPVVLAAQQGDPVFFRGKPPPSAGFTARRWRGSGQPKMTQAAHARLLFTSVPAFLPSNLQTRDGEAEEEEEEDYIDSEDEREEGEKTPHENAFVYIDESGKLVFVDPEDDNEDGGEAKEAGAGGLEEKEVRLMLVSQLMVLS